MKALRYDRFGGPELLEIVEAPDPRPGPGEVLIAVRAASIVPADWKLRAGRLRHLFEVSFPKIPGRDGAGVIVGVGEGVDEARIGEAVCFVTGHTGQGSHAELVARDAAGIVAKPAGLGFVEAAALMHAGICAWIALVETARLGPGDRVLIHGGAGAIGGMAVQLAKHLGAWVAASCRSANRDFVRGLGADMAIGYDRSDFAGQVADIDVVLDLIGGAVHARSYPVLRKGGVLVWLIAEPFEDLSHRYGVRTVQAGIRDDVEVLRAVVDLAEAGAWRPLVTRTAPLAEAAEAHRSLQAGANTRGRIVLEIG